MYCPHPASGALPARFRRQRILVVGCGDVGMRLLGQVHAQGQKRQILVLARSTRQAEACQAVGARVLRGDLDQPHSLARMAGLAQRVVHLAPPASASEAWWRDLRTQALVQALRRRTGPQKLVYASTSGVYGDRRGAWVDETALAQPHTPSAHRRADAERILRHGGRSTAGQALRLSVSILRVPAIYAADRTGDWLRNRLSRGLPVLARADDVYVNHVHADDLARACWLALWRGNSQRVYNVNDGAPMKMGDYFDRAATLFNLPRPRRLPVQAARDALPLTLLQGVQESRRMRNARSQRELGWRPRYLKPADGLREGVQRRLF